MQHDLVVAEIQARAHRRGMLSHYCRRGVACQGDRGLPDLVFPGGFLEVKLPGDDRSSGQSRWYWAIRARGGLVEQMGPADLDNGTVDLFLDHLEGR